VTYPPTATKAKLEAFLASIFGQKFLLSVNDEQHMARNPGLLYHSLRRLTTTNCCAAIGMTATPVVTNPQDLVNMGRILNFPGFRETDFGAHEAMRKQLATAKRNDSKRRTLTQQDEKLHLDLARGAASGSLHSLDAGKTEMVRQGAEIRQAMNVHTIRRTRDSKQADGKTAIEALRSALEHNLMVTLTKAHRRSLDDGYNDVIQGENLKDRVVSAFALDSDCVGLQRGAALSHWRRRA
jgi:hypothetical protein